MKKTIILITMLLSISVAYAQSNNRADTTILGVYNTGSRFVVTRADFGAQTATELLADMVIAYDTVEVATTVIDTLRSRIRKVYEKRCNTISQLVLNRDSYKDKIVLMALNKDCDVTTTCLLAQRSGAK